MYNPIQSTVQKVQNREAKKYKILCVPTHESYATNLSKTGHEFYMLQGDNIKKWDFHTKPLPPNHYLLNQNFPPHFPKGIEFDLILSQERTFQLPMFADMAQKLGIAHIHIDHTMPPPNWTAKTIERSNKIAVHKKIFITEFNLKAFGGDPTKDIVLPHGIDTSVYTGFKPASEPFGVSVVNLFPQRNIFCGWDLWKSVAEKRKIKLIGENPGMSESAKSTADLVSQLSSARYFLNTSQWSPVPLSLLEAMSVGLPIVSTSKQEIPQIIQHGVNGFLADSSEDIIKYIDILSNDMDLATKMGAAARQTIIDRFNIDQFIEKWNDVLANVYKNNV